MTFRLFQYPLPADPELADLNAYLHSQRVATVQQQMVTTNGTALLVFVVETIGPAATQSAKPGTANAKIDYREVLGVDDFALYSRLRDVRKQIAEAEGVPVYTVFTNAQLAEMITRRLTSATGLGEIVGIGKARVDKHAAQFIPLLAAAFAVKPRGQVVPSSFFAATPLTTLTPPLSSPLLRQSALNGALPLVE